MRNKIKNTRGITLIEILLVVIIIGVLAGCLAPIITGTVDAWMFSSQRTAMLEDARTSLFRMAREIRLIRGETYISSFSPTLLEFQDYYGNNVRLEQSGTDLLRNGHVMASGLKTTGGLLFLYFDGNDLQTTVTANIRRIVVALTLENGAGELSLQNQVCPRNLQ